MAAEPTGGSKPGPVLLRIKLRYEDVDTLVQRFAPNVGKAGVFLPTRSMQPLGAEVKFEIRLLDDTAAIVGLGRVKSAREPDPANPRAAFGIGVELMRVTRESRELILRMLERRKQLGLAEVAIPSADDLEASKRRETVSGPTEATPTPAPAPAAPPTIEAPKLDVPAREAPEPTFTAPRRPSGPIAVAKLAEVATGGSGPMASLVAAPQPLGPEPSRRHVRRKLDDVIASASAGGAAVVAASIQADLFSGGLADADVDLAAVLRRARSLAATGTSPGDVDAELDALREAAAAPLAEITVEAASAELARALGGAPIRKRLATAPVIDPVPVPVPVPMPASMETVITAPPQLELTAEPELEVDEADVEAERDLLVDRQADAIAAASLDALDNFIPQSQADVVTEPRLVIGVPAGPLIDDDADPEDFGDADRTQFGAAPMPPALDPATQARLAAALDDDDDDLGFTVHPTVAYHSAEHLPPPPSLAAIVPPRIAAVILPDEEDDETGVGEDDADEVDELEILAEADADDPDAAAAAAGVDGDFIARLELSNEHTAVPPGPYRADSVLALADQHDDDDDDEVEIQQETAARAYPAPPVDPLAGFDDDELDGRFAAPAPAPAPIERDLESALEALDVDLDDLGRDHAPRVTPRTRAPRAASEDGVIIEFDDDDDA